MHPLHANLTLRHAQLTCSQLRTGGVVGAGVQDDDGPLGRRLQVLNHALHPWPVV